MVPAALLCFLTHFLNEVVCFFALTRVIGDSRLLLLVAFIYDSLAFLPQGLIGMLSDRFPRFRIGALGGLLLAAGFLPLAFGTAGTFPALIVLSLGNACVHVHGAETTLRVSGGKMTPPAVFVGAGSFGLISGKLLGASACSPWPVFLLALLLIPLTLWADRARFASPAAEGPLSGFRYHDESKGPGFVLLAAVLIVAIRSYMSYGIPTGWNQTVAENVLLFCFLGLGKALGGVAIDRLGIRPTAILSIALSLPFLLAGDRLMAVSLIGLLLFSMTMPVTLAILVSLLPEEPGLAFGLTTAALFLGTLPGFFFRISDPLANALLFSAFTVLSLALCLPALPKKKASGTRSET